jgi:hypothetical protein
VFTRGHGETSPGQFPGIEEWLNLFRREVLFDRRPEIARPTVGRTFGLVPGERRKVVDDSAARDPEDAERERGESDAPLSHALERGLERQSQGEDGYGKPRSEAAEERNPDAVIERAIGAVAYAQAKTAETRKNARAEVLGRGGHVESGLRERRVEPPVIVEQRGRGDTSGQDGEVAFHGPVRRDHHDGLVGLGIDVFENLTPAP